MGIRTKAYEKASPSTEVRKTEGEKQPEPSKQEDFTSAATVVVEVEAKATSSTSETPQKSGKISKSPVKLRAPASMARLGGIKVGTRKLKKHRKRTLYVHSANKILRTSIKTNKTKRTSKTEEKARGSPVLPCRTSARTCVRRNSREVIPESPLRTVELIKRPVELREPATKLLFMASLGLYPQTGESDMTPIIVIKELCSSPGKKNGVRKSLELPLMPFHKRYIDLSNQDKRSFSENIKPAASKQGKKDQQKVTPVSPTNNNVPKESPNSKSDAKKSPSTSNLPPPVPVNLAPKNLTNSSEASTRKNPDYQPPPPIVNGFTLNNKNSIKSTLAATSTSHSLTITSAINKISVPYSSEADKSSSKSKSLLKNKLTMSSTSMKEDLSFYLGSSSKTNYVTPEAQKPNGPADAAMFNTYDGLPNAMNMNLMLSNVTIVPKPSITVPSRKRSASPKVSDLRYMEPGSITNASMNGSFSVQEKRPRIKRQKNATETTKSMQQFSLTSTAASANNSIGPISPNNFYSQSNVNTLVPEEALNLCVKNRPSLQPVMTTINNNKLPPKLQNTAADAAPERKLGVNGHKPLNLVIPRPPPLMKAPLEITNTSNSKCPQNVEQAAKAKSQPKKIRKPRQKNNQTNEQMQHFLPMMSSAVPLPVLPADTTVQQSHF